jgi:cell division septation protein DedD
MASTTQDEGFHEIQLNFKQLVFLFMAGTVAAVVIFLLGVFVGRGVRADTGDAAAIAATDAPTAPAIPPAVSNSGGPSAATKEDLSYPKRLGSNDAPRETLRAESASPAAAAPPSPQAAPPPAAAKPDSAAARGAVAGASAAPATDVPAEPSGDGFAIQVAALAKREEAETIVRRLTGKGYSAYVLAPASGAPSVFRVRVGKFKDRQEAEAVAARLQKEEQFKPWCCLR